MPPQAMLIIVTMLLVTVTLPTLPPYWTALPSLLVERMLLFQNQVAECSMTGKTAIVTLPFVTVSSETMRQDSGEQFLMMEIMVLVTLHLPSAVFGKTKLFTTVIFHTAEQLRQLVMSQLHLPIAHLPKIQRWQMAEL